MINCHRHRNPLKFIEHTRSSFMERVFCKSNKCRSPRHIWCSLLATMRPPYNVVCRVCVVCGCVRNVVAHKLKIKISIMHLGDDDALEAMRCEVNASTETKWHLKLINWIEMCTQPQRQRVTRGRRRGTGEHQFHIKISINCIWNFWMCDFFVRNWNQIDRDFSCLMVNSIFESLENDFASYLSGKFCFQVQNIDENERKSNIEQNMLRGNKKKVLQHVCLRKMHISSKRKQPSKLHRLAHFVWHTSVLRSRTKFRYCSNVAANETWSAVNLKRIKSPFFSKWRFSLFREHINKLN